MTADCVELLSGHRAANDENRQAGAHLRLLPDPPRNTNVLSRWIRGFADQRHRDFMCLEAELRPARELVKP
jgi:hypothetical protein